MGRLLQVEMRPTTNICGAHNPMEETVFVPQPGKAAPAYRMPGGILNHHQPQHYHHYHNQQQQYFQQQKHSESQQPLFRGTTDGEGQGAGDRQKKARCTYHKQWSKI